MSNAHLVSKLQEGDQQETDEQDSQHVMPPEEKEDARELSDDDLENVAGGAMPVFQDM
jgi:hypothetical protein